LDRVAYFGADDARRMIVAGQSPVLEEALTRLSLGRSSPDP
jgi:predicted NUDIX family NTP pyrophosphohydrolase